MAGQQPLKLYYFNARGRGELLRLLLAAGGREYEDVRINYNDWPRYKPQAPFGQAPFIELDGKKFAQSIALANFFAREFKLYGSSNLEALVIDQIVGLVQDLWVLVAKEFYEKNEGEKKRIGDKLFNEDYPRFLRYFEKMLEDNGTGYFVGDKLTLADLAIYDILEMPTRRRPDLLDSFPEVSKNRQAVASHDGVARHLASRQDTEF